MKASSMRALAAMIGLTEQDASALWILHRPQNLTPVHMACAEQTLLHQAMLTIAVHAGNKHVLSLVSMGADVDDSSIAKYDVHPVLQLVQYHSSVNMIPSVTVTDASDSVLCMLVDCR